jgi:ankyrin repeat protein
MKALKSQNISAIGDIWHNAPDQKALLDEKDAYGNTPLAMAVYLNLVDDNDNNDWLTPLDAVDTGDSRDFLGSMLGVASEANKRARNKDGNNLLHIVRTGKATNILLDDPVVKTVYNDKNKQGQVPLHVADTRESARRLLEAYAPYDRPVVINVQDTNGNTPLFYSRDSREADYLIEQGARMNLLNKQGQTPLIFVLTTPTFELTPIMGIALRRDALRREGLLPDQEIRSNMAFYFIEKSSGRNLVSRGMQIPLVDVADKIGNTALHYALVADLDSVTKKNLVTKLLAAGAAKNARNNNGKTALDLARDFNSQGSYDDIIMLLTQ